MRRPGAGGRIEDGTVGPSADGETDPEAAASRSGMLNEAPVLRQAQDDRAAHGEPAEPAHGEPAEPQAQGERVFNRAVALTAVILAGIILCALGVALARRGGAGGTFGVNASGHLGSLPSAAAADFTLGLSNGSQVRLADLRGQAVVVNFWASWCVPCRDEAPLLARVAREYRERGVTFLGISLWDAESDVAEFLARFGVDYPNGGDLGGRIAIEYGLTGIPETYFVRPDGLLSRRWIGPLNESQLRSFVEEIRPDL